MTCAPGHCSAARLRTRTQDQRLETYRIDGLFDRSMSTLSSAVSISPLVLGIRRGHRSVDREFGGFLVHQTPASGLTPPDTRRERSAIAIVIQCPSVQPLRTRAKSEW